jgi:hypothetical protein
LPRSVAPTSWLVQRHVEEGREAAEQVREGEMPPPYYTPLHGTARLSDAEREELICGLEAMLGGGRRCHVVSRRPHPAATPRGDFGARGACREAGSR